MTLIRLINDGGDNFQIFGTEDQTEALQIYNPVFVRISPSTIAKNKIRKKLEKALPEGANSYYIVGKKSIDDWGTKQYHVIPCLIPVIDHVNAINKLKNNKKIKKFGKVF